MKFLHNILKIFTSKKEIICECGKYPKCIRKIKVSNDGRVWVETEDHFKCGKTQNQIKELNKLYEKNI